MMGNDDKAGHSHLAAYNIFIHLMESVLYRLFVFNAVQNYHLFALQFGLLI
jgi:hypothetical protein